MNHKAVTINYFSERVWWHDALNQPWDVHTESVWDPGKPARIIIYIHIHKCLSVCACVNVIGLWHVCSSICIIGVVCYNFYIVQPKKTTISFVLHSILSSAICVGCHKVFSLDVLLKNFCHRGMMYSFYL